MKAEKDKSRIKKLSLKKCKPATFGGGKTCVVIGPGPYNPGDPFGPPPIEQNVICF